ncbi:hypothetical protein F9B85_13810, partial [Heliorestis acidaminivorans]
PLKFVSESFGAKVEWISRTRTVVITTGEATSDTVPVNQVISNVNELNRTDGINVTKAKVLTNNPYKMEISEGQTSRAIRVKGDDLGGIVLIKDGEVALRTQRASGTGEVVYIVDKNVDFSQYDYLGSYTFRNDTITLIPNPFK